MSAPGLWRELHLGSAACHVPCEKQSRGGRQGRFLSFLSGFVQLGGARVVISAIPRRT